MSDRKFHDLPEAEQVETPFGKMFVHYMFDDTNRSVRLDCVEGGSTVHPATVNRVEVLATLHMTDYGDGKGFVPRKDNGQGGREHGNDFHALHVTRWENSMVEVSWPAKQKLRKVLPPIVNAWAGGKGVEFAKAAHATISNDIGGLRDKLEEAESAVEALKAEIDAKEQSLTAIVYDGAAVGLPDIA